MRCSLCFFLLLIYVIVSVAAQQCVDTTEVETGFFAWDVAQAPPLLSALFPNSTLLRSAWETRPLLSKVSFAQQQPNEQSTSTNDIPVILHNRSSILQLQSSDKESGDPLLSLLTVDDIISIISQPHIRHGVDYKVAKKIIRNGEEHLGILPKPHYSIDEVLKHFHYGGFSVVINRMHLRWWTVASKARRLEEELNSIKIGVNMYLTPEVVLEDQNNGLTRQGFEPHWDWMDVVVIQLAGRKRWSVANEPAVYLSNKDQKRKPSVEEIKHYVKSPARFEEFTLCPGDVLYIPRGHIHNASTVLFDDLVNDDDRSLNRCPESYPSADIAKLLSWHGPSLHLTFGLEQGCEGTLESLLHHALSSYFDGNGASNSIAIPAESCSHRSQTATTKDVKWKTILHHALAEVARRGHPCDFPSFHGTNTMQNLACSGSASLRQSVPLGLSDNSDTLQYSHLNAAYLRALDIFSSSASIGRTAEFIQTLQKPPVDLELTFCFPGFSQEDIVSCPDALMSLTTLQATNEFAQVLMNFKKYASASFHTALKIMDKLGSDIREMNRKRQLVDLERVAQEYFSS
jgi:hypothetical protein